MRIEGCALELHTTPDDDNPVLQHVMCNLLYTGVTRVKRLVGQQYAVRNGDQRRRWSKLGQWLSA
ncbi:hypothetical protein D3273_24215 [Lichenibacterium minor]|uniref:UvrD-like helicase C-terminal domain-containing protein n=1 Tax=Lichenibacterium minor TaxID=2316528 RepID=A0A4Q2TZ94_9HYPH|nr:hypothetical protein D3273_24215 [Lichenibacterium minor]